jgi:hypothetical protein
MEFQKKIRSQVLRAAALIVVSLTVSDILLHTQYVSDGLCSTHTQHAPQS